jgi:hypothetical protein
MRHERADDKPDLPPRACSALTGRAPLATPQSGHLPGAAPCRKRPYRLEPEARRGA